MYTEETINKVLKNKRRLEKKLKVRLLVENFEIQVEGKEVNVYEAEKIIKALESGFSFSTSLLLLEPDYLFEEIPIKSISSKNITRIRARIIGQQGRTLKVVSELSNCHLSLHENKVSIIGLADNIKIAINAIKSLIQGSKQSNVYSYLEKQSARYLPEDLGLKE